MSYRAISEIPLPSQEIIDLVRYSCSELPIGSALLGESFYRNLFQMAPDIRDMFVGVNIVQQKQRMAEALLRVVHHLDAPEKSARYLQRLGAVHHEHMGVRSHHYPHIGRALVRAVSEVSPTWTSSMSSSWVLVYQWITANMIAGAEMSEAAKQAAVEGEATARKAAGDAVERPAYETPESHYEVSGRETVYAQRSAL